MWIPINDLVKGCSNRPRRKQLKSLGPPHRVNRVTRIGEPKASVELKDHDSCLLIHWVHMDMRAAFDLQIMDVDARSGENGVTGYQCGEQMEA